MHLLDSLAILLKRLKKKDLKLKEKIYMALDGYNNFTMTRDPLFILEIH